MPTGISVGFWGPKFLSSHLLAQSHLSPQPKAHSLSGLGDQPGRDETQILSAEKIEVFQSQGFYSFISTESIEMSSKRKVSSKRADAFFSFVIIYVNTYYKPLVSLGVPKLITARK